jgi:hypothetical protein
LADDPIVRAQLLEIRETLVAAAVARQRTPDAAASFGARSLEYLTRG